MAKIITLGNGLRIVAEPIPFVRSVSFGIWVKTGSRNETAKQSGMSHFIEHMLFKGTSRRTAADIAEEMDAIGGLLNAYTTKEYTCYYSLSLDTHFDTALDVLADMFFNSSFDKAEIKKEAGVICEEISMYEDTPEELVFDVLHESIWSNDSLGNPILGTQTVISAFSRPDFDAYMNTHYCPENTVIALAGNFDTDDIAAKVEKVFGGFKRSKPYTAKDVSTSCRTCIATKEKNIEQVHLVLGFPGLPIGHDDTYSLLILNTIFGGGMSSRLFQSIRETHGLAYSIYSYNSAFSDTGLFSIYAALNPTQTEKCFTLTLSEIRRLFTEKITPAQIAKAKEQLKSKYFLSLESTGSIMSSIGKSLLMLNRVLSSDDIMARIDAVDVDSVYQAAELFDFGQMSVAAVGPIGKLDFKGMIQNA